MYSKLQPGAPQKGALKSTERVKGQSLCQTWKGKFICPKHVSSCNLLSTRCCFDLTFWANWTDGVCLCVCGGACIHLHVQRCTYTLTLECDVDCMHFICHFYWILHFVNWIILNTCVQSNVLLPLLQFHALNTSLLVGSVKNFLHFILLLCIHITFSNSTQTQTFHFTGKVRSSAIRVGGLSSHSPIDLVY